jgi:hypothetical protein
MKSKQQLLDLARRLEEATGPDRELDLQIATTCGAKVLEATAIATGRAFEYRRIPERAALTFTASIDAAMTLVPEGFDWAVFRTNGGLTVHAWCGNREDVFGATPALALAAAALRARAETL